jgi:hypothetical protein
MSILLTGAGGLFTRLGKLAGTLNDVNNWRGGTGSGQLVKAVTDALAQVDGDIATIRNTYSGLFAALPAGQNGLTNMQQAVQTAAKNLLIAMANADTPLAQQTVPYALALLRTQMLAGGSYVNPNTVTATVTPGGSNTGNGAIVCGVRDAKGYQLDNSLAETVAVTVTADAANAGSLQCLGAQTQPDPLNWQWPGGSGLNQSLTSLDPANNTGYLTGGNFDAFTSNLPTGWTASVGTAGTDFGAAGSGYKGANALKYIGGTGVLSSLTQNFGAGVISSRTPYAINAWLKADVVPASGSLIFDLYNGASVIQDEAGNNCSLSINCHTLTTGYVAYGAVFTIADPVPATVTLRLRLSVAIPGGSNVFLDQLTFQPAVQLGTQLGDSIWAAACTGSADWALRDTLSVAVANNRTCKWQQAFDQFFGCRALGFTLPTSGSSLVNDSLISD